MSKDSYNSIKCSETPPSPPMLMLDVSKDKTSTISLGNLSHCLTTCIAKKIFLYVQSKSLFLLYSLSSCVYF